MYARKVHREWRDILGSVSRAMVKAQAGPSQLTNSRAAARIAHSRDTMSNDIWHVDMHQI
jgi:hypothetical protein